MKRVIPSLLLLPLLSSCVVQEGYYEPGYYPPPPPPPYVEVHRYNEYDYGPRYEHRHERHYRAAPPARTYYDHGGQYRNRHEHPNRPSGRPAVVVQPQGRAQAPVVHPHRGTPQVPARPAAGRPSKTHSEASAVKRRMDEYRESQKQNNVERHY